MNRWDEIQGAARDIAEQIAPAPEQRDVIADNLIKLVSLVVQGVGKGVAIEGESAQNSALKYGEETPGEAAAAHNRYILGERIQSAARDVLEESAGVDLERYERDGLAPAWTSKLPAAPELAPVVVELPEGCVCVPVPVYDATGSFLGFQKCKHQRAAVTASFPPVPVPGEVFTSVPAGPFAPGELTQLAHQAADDMREQHKAPVADERPLFAPGAEEYYRKALGLSPKPCDAQDCQAHGDAGRIGPCVQDVRSHLQNHQSGHDQLTYSGLEVPVQVPVVLHTWVTATDVDTGAALDYVHCGVCGIRKCDGGCGDASVGATPDVDCPTHGDDLGRQCNGSAVTCDWLPGDATTACDWAADCPVHGRDTIV